jgi:hypothetical protein
MATFTWSIAQLERNTSDNGVVVAHWRCTGVDGDNSTDAYGTCSFTPDPTAADFIAFDALTQADVLGWVHADVSQEDTEAAIQSALNEMATPSIIEGVPW